MTMKNFLLAFAFASLCACAFAGSYYAVFEYDVASGQVTMTELTFVEAGAEAAQTLGNINVSVEGANGALYSTTADVPFFISVSRRPNATTGGGVIALNTTGFSVLLPSMPAAENIVVRDMNGTVLLSAPVPRESPTPWPTGTPWQAPTSEPTPGPEPVPCCAGFLLLLAGLAGFAVKR